jgi:HD superfamily phosphohydrolase
VIRQGAAGNTAESRLKAIKAQRVRDPLHNLIEFDTTQFEQVLWHVVQTRPFQRLRRIKQLGFSELVYPGATHTRFAHSVGVFHTARILMQIITRHIRESRSQVKDYQAHVALAAALVHDLGHGMFSHAFEEVGKQLGLKMAHHEHVSDLLIRGGEVSEAFKELGSGFANDVADVIKRGRPGNLYDAVVSSQFDADRLDYMQRDRLMTGVQNSGIDFGWLMANLQIGEVPTGVDDHAIRGIETFVLGPKASHAAEAYVLALFQLYPTVYLHKATRGAEQLFAALMLQVIELARTGHVDKTGLDAAHPIISFAKDPESLNNALQLDDTVFWGALQMLGRASDELVKEYAIRLRDRRLLTCIDIRHRIFSALGLTPLAVSRDREKLKPQLDRLTASIEERLRAWSSEKSQRVPRVLTDIGERAPYKRFQESKGPLNQIQMRTADGKARDIAEWSSVIAGIETFELFRAYVDDEDAEAMDMVKSITDDELRRQADGKPKA